MRYSALIVAIACAALLPAQDRSRWTEIWADEFDAPANTPPDPSRWNYDLGGGGWGNQELEVYTSSIENAFHDGQGHLVIRALKTPQGGYTSARLKTQGKFEVAMGRIAARIKLPSGQGIWPAFWMLGNDIQTVGWPRCGEIDIMEHIGKEPGAVHANGARPGYSGAGGIGRAYNLPAANSAAPDFHVYAGGVVHPRHRVSGGRYTVLRNDGKQASRRLDLGVPASVLSAVEPGGRRLVAWQPRFLDGIPARHGRRLGPGLEPKPVHAGVWTSQVDSH